jgi:hypothetical protein
LKTFLDTSLRQVSGKSALAQAIRYALSRWKALSRYITNGRLEPALFIPSRSHCDIIVIWRVVEELDACERVF